MQGNGVATRVVARTQSTQRAPANGVQHRAPARMSLASIRTDAAAQPKRFLIYGVEGVGKTSLAAGAPNPIFLCSEEGAEELGVARFPEPKTWQDVFDALHVLLTGDHDYRTFVVDTADWLEQLIFTVVCKAGGKKSITEFGYGDGYRASVDHWRLFTSRCDELRRQRGMQIVVLGHSMVKEFKDPSNDAYERYQLKIYKDSAGWLREWADAVLFANYDVSTKETKRGRIRPVDGNVRFLHTQRTAAFDAKNRSNLPARIPLSWPDLSAAIAAGAPASPATLRRRIEQLAQKLDEAAQEQIAGSLERVGNDAAKLAHLLDWLAARVEIAASEADKDADDETATTNTEH